MNQPSTFRCECVLRPTGVRGPAGVTSSRLETTVKVHVCITVSFILCVEAPIALMLANRRQVVINYVAV
jgi:hypothetical protein